MITLLICAMLLTPPSIREIEQVENGERIEFRIPNGFGINNIIISVPKGHEENGRREAQALLDELHKTRTYYIWDMEVTVKQSTPAEEVREIMKFSCILNLEPKILLQDKLRVYRSLNTSN